MRLASYDLLEIAAGRRQAVCSTNTIPRAGRNKPLSITYLAPRVRISHLFKVRLDSNTSQNHFHACFDAWPFHETKTCDTVNSSSCFTSRQLGGYGLTSLQSGQFAGLELPNRIIGYFRQVPTAPCK